jgi:hypothetical protein
MDDPTIEARDPPALVNLAVTHGQLDARGYAATILDLAARGYLTLTESDPGRLRCALPQAPPPDSGLRPAERMVLGDVRTRLAAQDDGPLDALAQACWTDEPGCWAPFKKAVRSEADRRGLIRRGRRTAAGRDLAARWAKTPAGDFAAAAVGGAGPAAALKRLAYEVAAGVPVPITVTWAGVPEAGRPYSAWTSLGGQWRLVSLQPSHRLHKALPNLMIGLLMSGFLSMCLPWLGPEPVRPYAWLVPVSLLGGSMFLLAYCWGARTRADDRQRALDRQEAQLIQPPVEGQVIARWVAHGRSADHDYRPAIAIYDGRRVWSFELSPGVFRGVGIGDLVGVWVTAGTGAGAGRSGARRRRAAGWPTAAPSADR